MMIDSLVAACVATIESQHAAREQAIVISRALIRQCAKTIRAVHRSQVAEATQLLHEAKATAASLRTVVVEHPELLAAGYTQDALKEYAEAALVYAFLFGKEPPSAYILNVEPASYLNGLAEAASELRRAILDRLRYDDVGNVEPLLEIMDEVYSLLITVDYPDALTGGLRRTTDALRSVLERTRGDVTAACQQQRLVAALKEFEEKTVDNKS